MSRQGYNEEVAIELTYKKFPSLQEILDRDTIANQEPASTLKELHRYITDMAPSYYKIGLELDIVNSKLRVIENDPGLPGLETNCCKMLDLWLETDTYATWKKLYDALQVVKMSVLAERIKNLL